MHLAIISHENQFLVFLRLAFFREVLPYMYELNFYYSLLTAEEKINSLVFVEFEQLVLNRKLKVSKNVFTEASHTKALVRRCNFER